MSAPIVTMLISVTCANGEKYLLKRETVTHGYTIQHGSGVLFVPDEVVDAMACNIGYHREEDEDAQ